MASEVHKRGTLVLFTFSICILHTLSASLDTCEANGPCESDNIFTCETDQWLSQNGSIPGYHVLCITREPENPSSLNIKFYRSGLADTAHSGQYISSSHDFSSLRFELEHVLHIQKKDALREGLPSIEQPNPWGAFSPSGNLITDINLCEGTLLIFEGGVFIYPA